MCAGSIKMIIEFVDTAAGIRLNLLEKLERFTDPEVRNVRSLTGQEHIDELERFLTYLRPNELKMLKEFVEKISVLLQKGKSHE